MKKIFLKTAIVFFFLTALTACINDAIVDSKHSRSTDKTVSFVVNVAGANSAKSRALTEDDENTVKTVEVLLFDEAGKYTHQPIFSNDIVKKGPNQIAFTIKVPEGTFNMVLLANSREKVISLSAKLTKGMPKAAALDLLVSENSNKWNVSANSVNYQPIPMAGEIPTITITGDNTSISDVLLVRMLSKIDVNTAPEVNKNFNLTSVHLYNNSVKGQIVPNTDSWNNGYGQVIKPSIPTNAQNPNLGTALIYQGEEIKLDQNNIGVSCLNTIYTFETNKGVGDEGMSKNTCLVIGGKYDRDTKNTYYRVDFVSAKSNNNEYLALLRNHQYRVQITDVKGPGFDDPETAFQSRPVNIEASVVEWNDGDINDIVFDGQYLLGVSQSDFLFSKEARTNKSLDNDLYIVTDYPTGWTSKVTDDKGQAIDWLKISPASGGATKVKTKILLDENNLAEQRVGYILITAGRLSHVVRVTQSLETEFYLKTLDNNKKEEINGLDFISIDGNQVDRQEYNVQWKPVSSLLYYQINNIDGGGIVWDTTDGEGLDDIASPSSPISTYYQGNKNYQIRPIQFTESELKENPFILRSQIVIYGISDEGKMASKPFLIRHIAKNIIPIVEDSYELDGGKHMFHVRSNMPYTIRVKKDDKNVLKLLTTKGKEDISASGYPIEFELIDDTEGKIVDAKVTLLLTSPSGEFEEKEVIINCFSNRKKMLDGANSYMVEPNGEELLIPVSRCNEWMKDAWDKGSNITPLKDEETFTAHLIWTDNSNGLAHNSVVQSIGVKGKGPKGFLVVKPGSAEGNAMVAIKNTKGEILWSWHIWNTRYSPGHDVEAGEYMNRNLGAMLDKVEELNTDKTPETYGLLYQWGRKDPFPSANVAITNPYSTYKTIYDEKGQIISAKTEAINTNHNNLQKSVLNPDKFYFNKSNDGQGDWLTSYANEQNDNLWEVDTKSLYDPCPKGWKVPAENWLERTTYLTYTRPKYEYSINFLPYASVGGMRFFNTGLYHKGTNEIKDEDGYYWSSEPGMANVLKQHGTNVSGTGSNVRSSITYRKIEKASGAMVRCIKYNDIE